MKKKIISIITALAMVLTILPAPMMATDNTASPAEESTQTNTVYVPENVAVPDVPTEPMELTNQTTLDAGWYIVKGNVDIAERITVIGDVDLILADGAILTAEEGVTVNDGNSLTIWGNSTEDATMGKLIAGGERTPSRFAGIGLSDGDEGGFSGNITINGGNITAVGGTFSAGIGGASYGNNGPIAINGGLVTAIGNDYAAGIGSGAGPQTAGGAITINGGTIKEAKGGGNYGGAGIGGFNCNVTINNGIIEKSTAAWGGPGIGGGTGKITINGGLIKETIGDSAPGIGSPSTGDCDITITGGTIQNAKAEGSGAGIGTDGTILITGGTIENAQGGENSPGIGSYVTSPKAITITGGTITANPGVPDEWSQDEKIAGIGSEYSEDYNFSTTYNNKPGNAVIFTNFIAGKNDKSNWSGVIFEGDNGKVYGTPTISTNATIPEGKTLTLVDNQTLSIAENTSLINEGTIQKAIPVTFKVANGTWSDDKTEDIVSPVYGLAEKTTFNQDNQLTFGTAKLTESQIPTGMKANTGCTGGAWDEEPTADMNITADKTFTYSFTAVPPYVPPSNPDKSETITNPDGSKTTIVTKPNGTVISTTERTNGDIVEETVKPDGSSSTTEKRKDGTTIETQTTASGKVTGNVTLGKGQTEARITIPVKGLTPDQVPVLIKPDGSREMIKKSYGNSQGEMVVILHEDGTFEVIGNSVVFQDVEDTHWANPAIQFVSAREIFKGTAADTFSPELTMTRGMLVQVLYNFENQPAGSKNANFGDVASDAWFADAVDWAAENNIVSGVGEGQFAPNDNISREQLVTILYRYAGSPKSDSTLDQYSDATSVSSYAQDAMAWAVENGIVNGMGNNTLAPQGQATRAQVAQIIMNFCAWMLK